MSSPVDGLRDASGGSSEQETNPVCHNDDSLHKRATHENGIPIELEEELLKTPPYCIKTAVDKSDCNNRKMLNSVEQPTLKEEDADDVEGNGKTAVQSSDMMSLGPDFTITEINNHSSAIDKKTPIEVSIFKVDTTPTVNGNTTDAEDGLKTGHVNGMVVINNKNNSTNGSSDFTPSKPVVTPVEESEDTAEEPMDSESNQLKTKDIPVIKWGIMKKRQSTPPIRQKKYPVLAPKPFTDISSPQSPNSATIPAAAAAAPSTPNTHEVFLQFVGIPSQYIPTKTDKLPSDNKIKLQTITQQSASGVNTVQRPTALVNPLPAQKLVRDNSTAVSVLSKGTQADSIPESVFSANNIFGALVLNAPSLAVGEWKSKNSIDLSDSEKRSISSTTKVGSKQHQRWTQTTLLDFHKIKSLTTPPTNIQTLTTASAIQQQQSLQQHLQQQFRNKTLGAQSALGATTMLTSVLARLQVGGTVKVENAANNSIQQTKHDDANIFQHFLAAQQLAAADHVAGNPIAVLNALDQQQQISTTPAEVINMLKRLGTVVEVEEQNAQKPIIASDIPSIAADTATDQVPSPNALSLLENIKVDTPQSPVITALEESPANNVSSHQLNNVKCIPPIPTATFYLGKDVSVFPHVTPPSSVPSSSNHLPCTPSPVQPKRSQLNTNSNNNNNKSPSINLSNTPPTQPRLPPDVSVFATTKVATNNGIESKTVQQWSLPALVQQVGLTTNKSHQQPPQHVILEEINNMNLQQRNRLNQQQPLAPLPPILLQVTSINQPSAQRSPKRKPTTTTKDIPQQNHVTSLHPFEPEINIFEGDNVLSPDGNTFVFNMDTFCNVDLLNKDMIYSCDICSAVYQHPHRLKKHYLRLHINRKYISKKDLDTYNIDTTLESNDEAIEQDSANTDSVDGRSITDDCIKLVFRCHTCRKCVATKAELKSHLTDHPPVVNLKKQVVKGVKNFKCDYCKTYFKWKKIFLKHKKNCRLQPVAQDNTTASVPAVAPATVAPVTSTPIVSSTSSATPTVNTTPIQTKSELKLSEIKQETSKNTLTPTTTLDNIDVTASSIATPTLSSALTTPISSSAQSTPSSAAAAPLKRRRRRLNNNNIIRHYFHCLYCNETFLDSRKKRNHTLSNHPYLRKSHSCVFCQNDFTSNSSLFSHLLDVHPTIYFACLPCKDRFTNLEELGNHNDRKHKNENDKKIEFDKRISTLSQDKDCYTCDKCKRMFVIENCYKTHVCSEPQENENEKNKSLNSSTTVTSSTIATTTALATSTPTTTTATTTTTPNTRKSTATVSPNDTKTNNNTTANNEKNSTTKKDKPAKIRAKKSKISEREKKTDTRIQPVDPEIVFFSQISRNVRDNLMNHLDGRLAQSDDEQTDDVGSKGRTKKSPTKLSGVKRKTKSPKLNGKSTAGSSNIDGTSGNNTQKGAGNSSAGNSANLSDNGTANKPRSSHWEKYAFPKEYDGRCGLTSYIKDISYLDISTQMMIRRNMEMESMNSGNDMSEEYQSLSGDVGEVPSAIMLERMASRCAESYVNDDSTLKGGDDPLYNDGISTAVGELCGEWVRERTYVCQVCGWETSCLWSMEDHKYEIHASVVCPRLELVGDQRKLAKTIYTRLSEAPAPFAPSSSSPSSKKLSMTPKEISCTKCKANGFQTYHELHVHILECAGEKVPEWLRSGIMPNRSQTPRKKKWARKRRRPRRGLKRNIPSTPQKPNKLRSKPGDTDSIQKMIANLPAKRLTRRVIAFDEKDLKSRSQSFNQNGGKTSGTKGNVGKSKGSGHDQHLAQASNSSSSNFPNNSSSPSSSSGTMKSSNEQLTSLTQSNSKNNRIDTSAESGNVLSSLKMMPVSTPRPELLGTQQILDRVLGVSARVIEEEASLSSGVKCTGCGQSYESKAVLRRHHKSCAYFRECGPTSQHQCQTCHKTFDNLVALIEHSCEETPPRLEAEDNINRPIISAPVTRSKTDPDIPVLTPAALEADNKVTLAASKVTGKEINQAQSNLFGGYLIPLVVHNSPVNIIPITFTGTIPTVYNFTTNNIKSSLTLNDKTVVNANDVTNKLSRPKRKSSEDAAMAVFHTINSGRRSMNNPLRIEKKSTPRKRRSRKAVLNENTEKKEISQENAIVNKPPPAPAAAASTEIVKSPKKSTSRRRAKPGPRRRTQPRKILPKAANTATTEVSTEMDEVKSVLEEVLQKIKDEKPDEVENKNGTNKKRRRRRGKKEQKQGSVNVKEPPVQKPPEAETTPVVKRKPGRPFGSKTKNRNYFVPTKKGRKVAPPRRSMRVKNSLETQITLPPSSTPAKVTVKQESDDVEISNISEDLNINSGQKRSLSLDKSISNKQADNLPEPQDNKKRRSRWSGKQNTEEITSDTTTIVVQAEIHPEPSPRKVKKDIIGNSSDSVNSGEKPNIKRSNSRASLGNRRKRNGGEDFFQPRKKVKPEVTQETDVDEISVLAVEEIILDTGVDDEEEDAKVMETVEQDENEMISQEEQHDNLQINIDTVVENNEENKVIKEIKKEIVEEIEEVKVEFKEDDLIPIPIKEEVKDEQAIAVDDNVQKECSTNIEPSKEDNLKQEVENGVNAVKKTKRKSKKKKKDAECTVPSPTKKVKKLLSKDEKLKKNIKATALGIAKLKKKKRLLQVKNDKNEHKKKEVVKIAGQSWEISDLNKSPEKSCQNSDQIETFTRTSHVTTIKTKYANMSDPTALCTCPIRYLTGQDKPDPNAAPMCSRHLYRYLVREGIDPLTGLPYINYKWTEEEWFAQFSGPFPSSNVQPVDPAPSVIQQLSSGNTSQKTLCTLQPASFKQHTEKSLSSLLEQMETNQSQQLNSQSTTLVNFQQQDDSQELPSTSQQIEQQQSTTTTSVHQTGILECLQALKTINCSELVVQPCLPQLSQRNSSTDKTEIINNNQQNFNFTSESTAIHQSVDETQSQSVCEQISTTDTIISNNSLTTFTKVHEQTISTEDIELQQQPKEESTENFQPSVPFLTTSVPIPTPSPPILQSIESAQNNFTESSITELSPMQISHVEQQSTTLFPQSCTSFSQQQIPNTTKLIDPPILPSIQPQNSVDIQSIQTNTSQVSTVTQPKPVNEIKTETPIINEPCSANETRLNSSPAPSLGTIIDSVNKLLSEPDISTGGYSPLSQYSFLSDIQNYCQEDDLLVLQHLGESTSSFQNALSDANRDNNIRLVGSMERDCWSPNGGGDTKSLMDLDNQQPQQQQQNNKNVSSQQDVTTSMANTSGNTFNFFTENNNRLHNISAQFKDDLYITGLRRGKAQKRSGPTNWMDDHEGKEVVCPTCHSRFLGFSALKAHLNKAHPKQEPTPSGSGNSASNQVTGINRLGLDFSKNTKLVCPECQQILSSNLMLSHLSTEHQSDDISACQVLPDPIHDPAGGEILKSKLSSALGDLLDKAVNNLLIKSLPENQLRGSASELLTKLYALRMKDNSFKQKIINAQNDTFTKSKLSEKPKEADENNTVKNLPTKVLSNEQHSGQKFSSLLKDKQGKLSKQKDNKTADVYNFTDTEEYDNDWREAPSPSNNDDGTNESDRFNPSCSECGLSFPTLNELMRHRIDDHCRQNRRFSTDQSRPNTPNSSAAISSNASGNSTPFPQSLSTTVLPSTTATSSAPPISNVPTAISLANTLSRLQKRIRSSSVETQSSSGGCSVSAKGSRRGGGGSRGGGNRSRGRNSVRNNTRSSSLSSLNQNTNISQQDLKIEENQKKLTTNNDNNNIEQEAITEMTTTSDKNPEENKKKSKRTVKRQRKNVNNKEKSMKTVQNNKCNNSKGRKRNVVNNRGGKTQNSRVNRTSSQQQKITSSEETVQKQENELNTTNTKKRRSSTVSKSQISNNPNNQLPNNVNNEIVT